MINIKAGLACTLLVTLAACDSNSGSTSSTDSNGSGGTGTSTTLTGVFSDSAVAGVAYNTGSHQGITNDLGEFQYEADDASVTFSVGGIALPPVTPKPRVTPLDMSVDGADITDTQVVNILRFLQTLDEDSDPENGITITTTTSTALNDAQIDFSVLNFDDEAMGALTGRIDRKLVSEVDAMAHFNRSLKADLVGSWIMKEPEGVNILTFIDDTNYTMAHSYEEGEQMAGSVEYGTYHWDPATHKFSITGIISESDHEGGFHNKYQPDTSREMTLRFENDRLFLKITNDEGVSSAELISAKSANHPLSGSWYVYDDAYDPESSTLIPNHNVLVIYSPTQYVIVHTNNREVYADEGEAVQASSEWGTFSWSAETGKFLVTSMEVETDGNGGLFDKNYDPVPTTIFPRGNGDLEVIEETERFAFSRLGWFSTTLRDREGDTRVATVRRGLKGFSPEIAGTYYIKDSSDGEIGKFDVSSSDQYLTLILQADNKGTLTYPASEHNAQADTVTIEWKVSNSGVLTVTEPVEIEDRYFISFTPIKGSTDNSVLMRIALEEQGEPIEAFTREFINSPPAQPTVD